VEIRQLEHFLAVVDEGQFTRAALRCHVAQSGLSASVRALERDVGTPLLHRSTRQVALTDVGRAFVPEAREVLRSVARARDAVEAVARLTRGTLHVGTVVSAGLWFDLPGLLGEFHRTHPGVEVTMRTAGADELVHQVAGLELDVALVGMPTTLPDRLEAHPVATARYMVACTTDHPLSGARLVSVDDVADAAEASGGGFVDFSRETVIRAVIDQLFAAAGRERSVRLEVPDVDTVLRLVARGLGVAIVAEPPGPVPPGIALVPLAGAGHWTLAFVTLTADRASRAARAMLAVAGVSPAGVSPAGVSPAGVSPAGVSPAGTDPA
jgi:DNA-binding transcriptional LysR family regulator